MSQENTRSAISSAARWDRTNILIMTLCLIAAFAALAILGIIGIAKEKGDTEWEATSSASQACLDSHTNEIEATLATITNEPLKIAADEKYDTLKAAATDRKAFDGEYDERYENGFVSEVDYCDAVLFFTNLIDL